MNLREITIGRSRNCDIYLDQRCKYASNMHGTMFYDGNQLMFKDTSSNGTLINNVNIHRRAVPIKRGDIIMIAGKYPLNWNQIDSFFPYTPKRDMGTIMADPTAIPSQIQQPNLSKWNWGAFFLHWIWGVFNGCWWLLPIYILLIILCFIPILNIFAGLLSISFAITCGIKGTSWAWNNRTWNSLQDFEQTQSTWAKVGISLFCIGVFVSILSVVLFMSALTSLF